MKWVLVQIKIICRKKGCSIKFNGFLFEIWNDRYIKCFTDQEKWLILSYMSQVTNNHLDFDNIWLVSIFVCCDFHLLLLFIIIVVVVTKTKCLLFLNIIISSIYLSLYPLTKKNKKIMNKNKNKNIYFINICVWASNWHHRYVSFYRECLCIYVSCCGKKKYMWEI